MSQPSMNADDVRKLISYDPETGGIPVGGKTKGGSAGRPSRH